jgi:hypothetical protein
VSQNNVVCAIDTGDCWGWWQHKHDRQPFFEVYVMILFHSLKPRGWIKGLKCSVQCGANPCVTVDDWFG